MRMAVDGKERLAKEASASQGGSIAFRRDSLLSHFSFMKGFKVGNTPYELQPGRPGSAFWTDESIGVATYYYASVYAASNDGQGNWLPQGDMSDALRTFFRSGVITAVSYTHLTLPTIYSV